MGLTLEIAEFVSAMRADHAPRDAHKVIATGFTDCIAVIVAGKNEEVTRLIEQYVARDRTNEAVILSNGSRNSTSNAALVNATAAHALDYDDTGLNGHPSAVLAPAALAVADSLDANGEAAMTAYLTGYEVWAELLSREKDQLHDKGWHPTAMYGVVAAACAAAMLYKLDRRQTVNAVGLAASRAAGLVANFGSMTKPIHAGNAAASGIEAARLAALGVTASADALEHERGFLRAISPRGNVDTTSASALGKQWRITQSGLNIKLYPMCYGVHRSLDGLLELTKQCQLAPENIESIDIGIGETTASVLRSPKPATALEAKFSIQFAAAAAVIAGRCTTKELSDAFVQRADVQRLCERVRITTTKEVDPDEPIQSPLATATVTLNDGRVIKADPVRYARGHARNPASQEDLWRKFHDCVSGEWDSGTAKANFVALQSLDRAASISALSQQLACSRNSIGLAVR